MAARLAPQRNFITLAAGPAASSNVAVSAMSSNDDQQSNQQQFGGESMTTAKIEECDDTETLTTTTVADTTATLIVMSPQMADEHSGGGGGHDEMYEHSNGSEAEGEGLHDDSKEIEIIPMAGDEDHDDHEEGDVAAMHESINEQIQLQQHEQEQRTQLVQHTILPQKKYILQSSGHVDGVPVIDVLPMLEATADGESRESDSSPASLITVRLPNSSSVCDPNASNTSGASSPHSLNGSTSQQLTAQVAVVQTAEDMEPHYITVTVQQDNVTTHETYHVQYVDSEHLYGAGGGGGGVGNGADQGHGQNQMSYPVYAVEDYATGGGHQQQQQQQQQTHYYTSAAASNYTHSPTSTSHEYILPDGSEHMLDASAGASATSGAAAGSSVGRADDDDSPVNCSADMPYIDSLGNPTNTTTTTVTGPTTPTHSSDADSKAGLSHATRVSPATVAWLMDNYENAEGVSLPRSTLYNHYMHHCNEHKLDAVNAASFGKLIRSVFTGLRTRRLGTRGNSKYHYYGIRVKPTSGLSAYEAAVEGGPPAKSSATAAGSAVGGASSGTSGGGGGSACAHQSSGPQQRGRRGTAAAHHSHHSGSGGGGHKSDTTYETCSQYLGDGLGALPNFPHIDVLQLPLAVADDDITAEDVDTLRSMYREHCEAFLDAIHNLEFGTVESLWREFWRTPPAAGEAATDGDCEEERYLSKYKLYALSQCAAVQEFVRRVDYSFYQSMVDVLIPDVLRPIPSTLTQAIRNFAKNLEAWLAAAMVGCPEPMVRIKMAAVAAFAQTLRRYTSLNHLAQAARAVLQNHQQIGQMLSDLNRVDFHNVQEQAAWVCQCDPAAVQQLELEFKAALQQQNTLEQWAAWLRQVVENALQHLRGKAEFATAARQFLLKWSFYSSMVIRDLTLRSAASFGSFHLIRLLYDEYMFYIVEHKVAEATQTTPIAVMVMGGQTMDGGGGSPQCKVDPLTATTTTTTSTEATECAAAAAVTTSVAIVGNSRCVLPTYNVAQRPRVNAQLYAQQPSELDLIFDGHEFESAKCEEPSSKRMRS